MAPLLCVEELRTSFWTPAGIARAVDGVSFTVRRGEVTCLVGESGCGKSVTALSMLGLLDLSVAQVSGSVRFAGREILHLPPREMRQMRGGRIAMVFQEPATSLNPVHRIGEQVAEAVRLHARVSRRAARDRAVELLAEVQVREPDRRARQYPHELSGGLKQRAMIAMALAGGPELLIADEPTTALDVTVQSEILALFDRLRRERGLAIVLITHDLGVVAQQADQVVVLYAGQVVERAPTVEIFARPGHPYTRGLLRSVPSLRADTVPEPIAGMVPSATCWPAGCRFRDRCNEAFEQCAASPILVSLAEEHQAACWLHAQGEPP